MRALLRRTSTVAMAISLSACGGGSGSGGATAVAPPPASPPASSTCSLRARQDWAAGVLREWYLFPETLPANLDPAPFASVDDYVDALTATARSQRRDRFFTHRVSIREEDAFFSSGSTSGFGFRLSVDTSARRAFIAEAFEGAPALAAGIDRGTEILAVGETAGSMRLVSDIIAAEGGSGVSTSFGPATAGVARVLRISDASGTREVTVTKAAFEIPPISGRYGVRILNDGGRQIAYLNLRTFISTADSQLRSAFADFRARGINQFVIDFRYNGGGLVSTAELMGDLLGGNRLANDVFSITTYRPEKSSNNETRRFQIRDQSVAPVKIAFITTGATASASELVINALSPYLGDQQAIVGANTFGKPVGQIAIDRSACDDRLRVVAFSTQNSVNGGFYYDGLASTLRQSCRAADDITRPLGDPQEASLRQALDYLAGRSCTPIAAGGQTSQASGGSAALLRNPVQRITEREVPGFF